MNKRAWYDNWWMGWIFGITWVDVFRVINPGKPRAYDFAADVITAAVIAIVSYRNRSRGAKQ